MKRVFDWDTGYDFLLASLLREPDNNGLKIRAGELAMKIRSHLVTLSYARNDNSPEYDTAEKQCRTLAFFAGDEADELLREEYAPRNSKSSQLSSRIDIKSRAMLTEVVSSLKDLLSDQVIELFLEPEQSLFFNLENQNALLASPIKIRFYEPATRLYFVLSFNLATDTGEFKRIRNYSSVRD